MVIAKEKAYWSSRQGAVPKGTRSKRQLCHQALERGSPSVPRFPCLCWRIALSTLWTPQHLVHWQFENRLSANTASWGKAWHFISGLCLKQNLVPLKEGNNILKHALKHTNWNTLFFFFNSTNSNTKIQRPGIRLGESGVFLCRWMVYIWPCFQLPLVQEQRLFRGVTGIASDGENSLNPSWTYFTTLKPSHFRFSFPNGELVHLPK